MCFENFKDTGVRQVSKLWLLLGIGIVSVQHIGKVELLMECKQYLIERKRERIFQLYKSYRKHFLEDFFLGGCKTWAGNRPFVTAEVVKRLFPYPSSRSGSW